MFLTLYKAGFETQEFRKNCSPVGSLSPLERGGASSWPTGMVLVLRAEIEIRSCIHSQGSWVHNGWMASSGCPFEAPGQSKETPKGLCSPQPVKIPCRAKLLILLLVLCSNSWIISRDETLQRTDDNGLQPTRMRELEKPAPRSLLLHPELYNMSKSSWFMILLPN